MRMKEFVVANNSEVSAFQAQLINLIGRNDGISQLTLRSITERDKAQVARAIKELETNGFVARLTKASGQRTTSLTLTPEGRSLHTQLNALRGQLASEALSPLTLPEKQSLQESLQKISTLLNTRV